MKQVKIVPMNICRVFLLWALFCIPAVAQTITEIIDETGDGAGNVLTSVSGISVDDAGNVYVIGGFTSNAFKITPAGVITEIIDATGDGAGHILKTPQDIAADSSGNAYVAGYASNNAFQITVSGVVTEIISLPPCAGLHSRVQNIAVDGLGNVYITTQNCDNAFKITPGGVITEIIDATGDGAGNILDRPKGIAVDGSGNVYVTGYDSHNAFRITPGGVITEIIDATGDGAGNNLDRPQGIAIDGSGNAYVTGLLSNNAFKITPQGVITEIIDATGDGSGNTLSQATAVDVDGSGNIYISGGVSSNAFKITPGGVITEIIDAAGDGVGNILFQPQDIAVDDSGIVYIAGTLSHNAFMITPAGPSTGSIFGTVSVGGAGLGNILVKLLDESGIPVAGLDDVYTNSNGEYSFVDVPAGDYQVMVVEPLGYESDQNYVGVGISGGTSSIVDFELTPYLLVNEARSKGYWKHQFDVYVKGRGNAQESETELMGYIAAVRDRYTQPYYQTIFEGMADGSEDFEEWQAMLSVRGNAGMEAKATSQLAALALNVMSLKVAQFEVVTEEGLTAGDVLVHVSGLVEDGDPDNDELAKDLAEAVNFQETIAAGLVDESDIFFYQDKPAGAPGRVLMQNYPNPFNPNTKISFSLPPSSAYRLSIYDVAGRLVRLYSGNTGPGRVTVHWNGNDDAGTPVGSGAYFYRLEAGSYSETKRMVLVK